MNFSEDFMWIIFPYIAITVFVVGLLLRYDRDPYGWTSKSSQILEARMLMLGSMMFHYAFLLVVIGHFMGLVIPVSFYNSLGITFAQYHKLSFYGGAVSGIVAIGGLVILLLRRLISPQAKVTTGIDDFATLGILFFALGSGLLATLGYTIFVGPYDYRQTVGPWLRSLFTLSPNPSVMASTPVVYQAHVLLGLLFFALVPFTRLVHMFSLPVPYLWRKNIVYRSVAPESK